jgi:hypothetical protein
MQQNTVPPVEIRLDNDGWGKASSIYCPSPKGWGFDRCRSASSEDSTASDVSFNSKGWPRTRYNTDGWGQSSQVWGDRGGRSLEPEVHCATSDFCVRALSDIAESELPSLVDDRQSDASSEEGHSNEAKAAV